MFKPLTLILALLATPGAAHPAKWEVLPESDPSGCDFRFSGWIEEGDLTGFVEVLRSANQINISICLDSEGGILGEMLAFLDEIGQTELYFSTKIERNAVCVSACALLFMFGTEFGRNAPSTARYLERGGRLGFKALLTATDDDAVALINEVFLTAMEAAKLIADRSYQAFTLDGPPLPQELLSLLFGSSSDEIHFIEQYGELALLGIEIDPPEQRVSLPNGTNAFQDTVRRICASSHVLSNAQFYVKDGYRFSDLIETVEGFLTSDFELHRLARRQGRWGSDIISAKATGPYWKPMDPRNPAELFCQVDFAIEEVTSGFQINRYQVGFGYRTDPRDFADVSDRIFDWEDLRYHGMSVGLVPIDQRYE